MLSGCYKKELKGQKLIKYIFVDKEMNNING
jgi:hypothetical protein